MPKRYRLGLADVQAEAESVGLGTFRVGRPEASKAGVKRTLREDKRPVFGEIRE